MLSVIGEVRAQTIEVEVYTRDVAAHLGSARHRRTVAHRDGDPQAALAAGSEDFVECWRVDVLTEVARHGLRLTRTHESVAPLHTSPDGPPPTVARPPPS